MVIKTLPIPSNKPPEKKPLLSRKPLLHSQSLSALPDHRSEQHRLPDANELRRMCIITKTDLNRIYDNLDRRQRDKDAIRQELERRKQMTERSAEITKHWPNTIIGDRERKLEMKKLREEKEEERRKAADIEEERLAAERRREQIERAKQVQYYTNDRVRSFHSALLLTEVLKERDLQLEMKKRFEQMRQESENDFQQRNQEGRQEFYKIEQEKIEQKAKERANLTKYQLAQIDQHQKKVLEEKEKDRQEGDEYRRLANDYALEQLETERFKKLTQRDIKNMYDKALEDKRKLQQLEQKMDEDEEDGIRGYAEAKKKIVRLKREKEIQFNQERQELLDQTIGYLGTLHKRAEGDHEVQIFRARAEQEARALREEQEKLEKQQKMKESIKTHRQQTFKRREADRQMEEREEADRLRKRDEADRLFRLYQQEKEKQRNQNAQTAAEHHLKQVQERKDRQRELKVNEIQEVERDKYLNEVEKQQYQDYTGRVISYLDENGRNTLPLKRAVADELKRFDQVSQGYKISETPRMATSEQKPGHYLSQSLDETKKNLGFQWNIPNK